MMLSSESIELLKKNQVLFSIDEFIPSNNEPFNAVEFVQSYRRRVRNIGVLKEELKKLSKLIDYLISQEINQNYEAFIKYSVFLGQVKKQINERMESLGDNTEEIPVLGEFYEKVVKSILDSELFLHKSEIYSRLKKYAKNTRHLYGVLCYNLREWYQEFKENKDIIFFDQISVSLREFHEFFHGELENSQKELLEILKLNEMKFKQDQDEPEIIDIRKRIKKVRGICQDCYDQYSKYYNTFKNDLRFYFLKYSFGQHQQQEEEPEDFENLQIIVRSISQLHLFRWIENVILQDVIGKKVEIIPPRRIVGVRYLYDFDQLKRRIISTFKTPLFESIDREGLSKEFKLFDNIILKYLSDFVFFNPRFKFLYSLIDETNFHSHYHAAIGFLRDLCQLFNGNWDLTTSIRKKWSVRLYFISNKKKMMESFEEVVEKDFQLRQPNVEEEGEDEDEEEEESERKQRRRNYYYGIFRIFEDLTRQLFSPEVFIEAKGKDFFSFFLSLISRFKNYVTSDHILFRNLKDKCQEEDLVALYYLRVDSVLIINVLREELVDIIHSATQKDRDLLHRIIDEWVDLTFFRNLIPLVDDSVSSYIVNRTLKEFNMMKTHYMSIATSEKQPETISGFVIRMFFPIEFAFSKSEELGVQFDPSFKKSVIQKILEKYKESYDVEVEGFRKRRRSLMKLRNHQRTRSHGDHDENVDGGGSGNSDGGDKERKMEDEIVEEDEGVKMIFEQIKIDNEEIWKRVKNYLTDENEREMLKEFFFGK